MSLSREEIENRVSYHSPTPEAGIRHDAVRAMFRELLTRIVEVVPDGREQSLAITHAETAMFWCNGGIARNHAALEMSSSAGEYGRGPGSEAPASASDSEVLEGQEPYPDRDAHVGALAAAEGSTRRTELAYALAADDQREERGEEPRYRLRAGWQAGGEVRGGA